MNDCPDEELLAAFFDGGVSRAAEDRLHAHFDVCPTCRRVVAGVARQASVCGGPTPDSMSAPPVRPGRWPAPGARIGRYIVVGVLGRGGMGVVLRAVDPRLDRPVAIKLHAFEGESARERDRQLAEARALARLSHPNIVEIYDVGLHEGRLYLAMELIEGPTLSAWGRARVRSVNERLECLIELGEGLAAVHAAGLVHRDFKPDNAIVAPDGRARIVDFGLARTDRVDTTARAHAVGTDSDPMLAASTRTGLAEGTPVYMPPEQHAGAAVDGLADQFAFCVSAFEILHGYRPFVGRSLDELVRRMQRGTISHRGRCDVPREVEAALRRGLRPDPRERFRSLPDLLDALRRSRRSRRLRWIGATGLAAGSATLVAVASASTPDPCGQLVGEGTAAWAERRGALRTTFVGSGLPDAQERWTRVAASIDAYADDLDKAEALACAPAASDAAPRRCLRDRQHELVVLVDALTTSDADGLQRADAALTGLARPEVCRRDAGARAGGDEPRVVRIEAELARASARMTLGRYEEGLAIANAQFAAAQREGAGELTASIELHRGVALRHLARWDDARRALTTSYFAARDREDTRVAVIAGLEVATLLGYDLRQPEAGLRWLDHVEAAFPDAVAREPKWVASVYDARGMLLSVSGDQAGAEAAFRAAVAVIEDVPEVNDDDRSTYLSHVATTLLRKGDLAEALPLHERVLQLQIAYFGPDHLNVVGTRTAIATALHKLGRIEEARVVYRDLLALAERTLPSDHPAIGYAANNLGTLELARDDVDAAAAAFDRALRIFRAAFGEDDVLVAMALGNRADVHRRAGELDAALTLHHRAAEMMALHPEAPEQRVTTLGSLGLTQWLAGDNEAALASFEDAIVQLQAIPTPPPDLATIVWRDRCVLLLAQDDPLAAAEACEHADRNRTGADLVPDDRARLERAHVWLDLLQGASPDSLSWPVPEQRDETDAHVDEAFDRALATRRRPTARPGS